MADYHVTWIYKPGGSHNPRTRIEKLGGTQWSAGADDVIRWVNGGQHRFTVTDAAGDTAWVEVDYRNGTPYLRTHSDQTPLDNLLSLTNRAG